jgi:hypothetical protein
MSTYYKYDIIVLKLLMQTSNTIVLIKPKHFAFNKQTAVTNSFQNYPYQTSDILYKVQQEFKEVVNALQAKDINSLVFEDQDEFVCADAVFCNNWFSTHANGKLIIYPMCTENRRLEVRNDIVEYLQNHFTVNEVIDLRKIAQQNEYLESTGSIVFDHEKKLAFACLSKRTNDTLVNKICDLLHYKPIVYKCVDDDNMPIYHTNVILCISSHLIIAFVDGIKHHTEKEKLLQQFSSSLKELLLINYEQVKAFCGNLLAISNTKGKEFIVLSKTAYQAFTKDQLRTIKRHHEIILVDIPNIENIGGGGVRCMLAQIFLLPRS